METLKSITIALICSIFAVSFTGEMIDVDWSTVPLWELALAGLFVFIPTFCLVQSDFEI